MAKPHRGRVWCMHCDREIKKSGRFWVTVLGGSRRCAQSPSREHEPA